MSALDDARALAALTPCCPCCGGPVTVAGRVVGIPPAGLQHVYTAKPCTVCPGMRAAARETIQALEARIAVLELALVVAGADVPGADADCPAQ